MHHPGEVIHNPSRCSYANASTSLNPSSYGTFTITSSTLSWAPIPEPTNALAGLLLMAGLLRRRRAPKCC